MEKDNLGIENVGNIPQYLIDLAKEVNIDISGLSQEDILKELDKIDPCWIDEINDQKC